MTKESPLEIHLEPRQSDSQPAHHVLANTVRNWTSYLPSWDPSPKNRRPKKMLASGSRTGFRNPWPSWHKPTRQEVWRALQWGQDDQAEYIELAISHLEDSDELDPERLPRFSSINDRPDSAASQAARLLRSQEPDLGFDQYTHRAKVTWLGHASIHLQLAAFGEGSRPLCCLFDPVFSSRCSPSATAGPIRAYRAPCDAPPPVDVVLISHNHYDHLDWASIMSLWERNKDHIRFLVPLGNLDWFVGCGIPAARVTELDWWDSVRVTRPGLDPAMHATIWCTPAQHSSGRTGTDADCSLWSSWYIASSASKPCRVFFAGDTGYQFHDSSDWPPPPSRPNLSPSRTLKASTLADDDKFPPCPAFAEIRSKLGVPDILLLPISVGATYSYLRSLAYLPNSLNPIPRHRPGLTAGAHMPPWDAVRVLRAMTGGTTHAEGQDIPVAIAMHWGTFVTEPCEVLGTLGQLEWACHQNNVTFCRSLDNRRVDDSNQACFLVLNHGQSVQIS